MQKKAKKYYATLGTCSRLFKQLRTLILHIYKALLMLFQKMKTACLYDLYEKVIPGRKCQAFGSSSLNFLRLV
jgi:hypothetical protein